MGGHPCGFVTDTLIHDIHNPGLKKLQMCTFELKLRACVHQGEHHGHH